MSERMGGFTAADMYALGELLREQATDHHNYRRDSEGSGEGGHRGPFDTCPTLRCQRIREVVAWAKGSW